MSPLRRWCRAALSDRGSSAIELAVLAPALMLICMLILQFGLWFNARQTALAARAASLAAPSMCPWTSTTRAPASPCSYC